MSRRLPRLRRKLSRTCICSLVRRANRPTPNSPSMVVPQVAQRSRVTASSPEQTGQVAMTSWGTGEPLSRKATFVFIRSAFLIVKTYSARGPVGCGLGDDRHRLGPVQREREGVACNVLYTRPADCAGAPRRSSVASWCENPLEGACHGHP